MPKQEKQSRLAEWGSRPMAGREKVLLSIAGLVLFVGTIVLVAYVSRDAGEDRRDLEEQLNSRYEETITVRVISSRRMTSETIILDGIERFDCDATDDGYLECSEDPQPTPEYN